MELNPVTHLWRGSCQSVSLARSGLAKSEDRAGETAGDKGVTGPGRQGWGGAETHSRCSPRLTHPCSASSPRRFTPHALNTSSCVHAPSSTAPKRNAMSGPPPGGLTWKGDGIKASTVQGQAPRRAGHSEERVFRVDVTSWRGQTLWDE